MRPEISCRMALPSDSVTKIAKYLHLTDPYIYPLICSDPEDSIWVEFIRACLESPGNIYHLSHIAVLLHREEIIGVACVAPCGQTLTIADGIPIPERMQPVLEGYFLPLIQECRMFSGHNVVNICVDAAWQHQGLGGILLNFCLETLTTGTVHLDVIASNAPAIRLYERYGFAVSSQYMGFSGSDIKLPCYHMIRKR